MKREHDEMASEKRKEDYSKPWFIKGLELLKRQGINFKNIIDIGAGKGEFLEILKDNFNVSNMVGVDYIESDLKVLTSKGIKVIKIDLDNFKIEEYPNLKDNFDLVVCLETIEHIFNTDRLFQFFYHLLKENGYLLISTPNYSSFLYKLFYLLRGYPFGENHHIRFFTKKRLQQYAFFNGFNTVRWNNYFSFGREIIKRGFGARNKYLVYFLIAVCAAPLFVSYKLNLFNSLSCSELVVLFRKTNHRPLGLEIANSKENFINLPEEEKELWIERIKKYSKKDKLTEHIYFKTYIEEVIQKK